MADLVVSEGYAAVGYEYINIDDCWLEKSRGQNGELVADKRRFPRGIKDLADYVRKYFFYSLKTFYFNPQNICRSMQKVLNLVSTKIMGITHVLAILEFLDIYNKMPNFLLHGMWISLN